jgi:hypothetical protein
MAFIVVYNPLVASTGVIPKNVMAFNIWRNTQLKENNLL